MRHQPRRRATDGPTAVLYMRVGSAHPDDIASATRWQRARILEGAAVAGWRIAGAYVDAATPASRRFTDRPKARALIEHLAAAPEGSDAVLVNDACHAFGTEQTPAVLAALPVPVYELTPSGVLSPVGQNELITRLPRHILHYLPATARPGSAA